MPAKTPEVIGERPRPGDIVLYALPHKVESVALIVSVSDVVEEGRPFPVDMQLFVDLNDATKAMLETNCVQLAIGHFYVGNVTYNPTAEWVQNTWRQRD